MMMEPGGMFICSINHPCVVCSGFPEFECNLCDAPLCEQHALVPLLRADDRAVAGDDVHLCPECSRMKTPLRVRVERST